MEQYFHAWRSLQYNESTHTVDSYIHRVKQVGALLNYGETAKRLLMKEQIDKQRTGQSSVSPFMKASQQNPKKNEKGVTFGAMETIKRHGNSIDKLTSFMNKLDMKLDRREAQYRPKIFQGRNRGCRQRQDRFRSRDRFHSRECSQYKNNNRGRRNIIMLITMTDIIDPIIETTVGLEIEAETIDLTIGPTIEETIIDKTMVTKGIETEV